jgi:hypothetical protein
LSKSEKAAAEAAAKSAPAEAKRWIRPSQLIDHGYQKLHPGVAVELPEEAAKYYVAIRWAEAADGPEADPAAAAAEGAEGTGEQT